MPHSQCVCLADASESQLCMILPPISTHCTMYTIYTRYYMPQYNTISNIQKLHFPKYPHNEVLLTSLPIPNIHNFFHLGWDQFTQYSRCQVILLCIVQSYYKWINSVLNIQFSSSAKSFKIFSGEEVDPHWPWNWQVVITRDQSWLLLQGAWPKSSPLITSTTSDAI